VVVFCVFLPLGVIYNSQVTNRSAAGEGGSLRKSFLLPIGRLEEIYDSSRTAIHFFTAIQIRVNALPASEGVNDKKRKDEITQEGYLCD
jgi:hypothetical protein